MAHLLITGVPGSGKTTLIRRVAERLADVPGGFYTEEIRKGGTREGFRLVTFDGEAALIAHIDLPKTHRVSKYGVDVAAIDQYCENALVPRRGVRVYLVDEIGKMECLSDRFIAGIRRLLDSELVVVATIAARGGGGFIGEVKRRKDCELWTLTRSNRDDMAERVLRWIEHQK